jgi:hypothetical protein
VHSGVIIAATLGTYELGKGGSTFQVAGIWELGVVAILMVTMVSHLRLCKEALMWSAPYVWIVLFSVGLWWAAAVGFSLGTSIAFFNPMWGLLAQLVSAPNFWLAATLGCSVCFLLTFGAEAWQNMFTPFLHHVVSGRR